MIRSISVTPHMVHVVAGSELTDADLTRVDATMLASPYYHPGIRVFWDLTAVEKLMVHSWCLESLVKIHSTQPERYQGNCCAIVAKRLDLLGLARVYQQLARGLPMKIKLFRRADRARQWLARQTLAEQ